MSESTAPKQSLATKIKNTAVKYERPVLITTTALSVGVVVLQAKGIKLHNEFLKERGLFEEFYDIAKTTTES